MKERLPSVYESEQAPESSHERHEHESGSESRIEPEKHEHKDNLDKIKTKIEEVATSKQEFNRQRHIEDEKLKPDQHVLVDGQLRNSTLERSLQRIRRDLKPYQRPFSRFIHNSTVDSTSEALSKTIANPNGLLIGGLTSFIASLAVLVLCRYYGYEYNYLIGLVSFPAGFVLGLLGVSVLKLFRKRPVK